MRLFKLVCFLLCLMFFLPAPTLATTYSQIAVATGNNYQLQVIGLGASDGYAYLPVWQDTSGTWHQSGVLPGQSTPFSQLVAFTGPTGLQVIGLGKNNQLAYQAAWQDWSGAWHAGAELPQTGAKYTKLAVEVRSVGCATNSQVEVIGLGASDDVVHGVAYEDCSGNWHGLSNILETLPLNSMYMAYPDQGSSLSGIPGEYPWGIANGGTTLVNINTGSTLSETQTYTSLTPFYEVGLLGVSGGTVYLPYYNGTTYGALPDSAGVALTRLAAAQGNQGQLQVWGLGTDGYAHMVNYQDTNGNWHTVGSVPTYSATISSILMIDGQPNSNVQVLARGTNGHVILVSWQDNSSGTWYAGNDLTPSSGGGGGGGGGSCKLRC